MRALLRKPACEIVLLVLLPVVIHWRSLSAGLFLDDFAILARLHAWEHGAGDATWWDLYVLGGYDERLRFSGLLPWWTSEHVQIRFFRPLAAATHALDVRLWPDRPWAMHLHSTLWLSAATLACRRLYALVLERSSATLAATVFAASYVHAWPVGWIANRNALVALTFGALALGAYVKGRQREKVPWAAPPLLLASLLSAESGVALVAIVLAFEATLGRELPSRRWISVGLLVAVVALWRAAYSHWGFGAIDSGTYIDPLHAPLAFLEAAPRRAADLAYFLASPAPALTGEGRGAWPIGVPLTLLGAAATLPALKPGAHRLWLLGALLSLPPLLTSTPQPRLLGPAVVSFAPLVAAALAALWHAKRPVARVAAVALGALHLAVSPLSAAKLVDEARLADGSPLGEPGRDLGDLKGKNLYILGTPSLALAQEVTRSRTNAGLSLPAFTWILAVGEVDRARRGCCVVVARDPDGLFREHWSALYRGRQVAFSPGDRVKTLGFEATVTEVGGGLATEVEIELGGPLRSRQFVLARWAGSDFELVLPRDLPRVQRLER